MSVGLRGLAAALFLGLGLGPGFLAAQEGWLYGRGDEVYEAAYRAALRGGSAPSFAWPLFGAELGERARRAAATGLRPRASTPSFWYDSPYPGRDSLSGPPSPSLPELQDAILAFPEALGLSAGMEPAPGFSLFADFGLGMRRDWPVGEGSSLSWTEKDWMTGLWADIEFPRRTWIAYARPGIGLAAGRFASGLGAGQFSSASMNPRAPYYDQLRLHLGDERLRLVYVLSSSSPQLSAAEAEIQRKVDSDGTGYWDDLSDHDFMRDGTAARIATWHLLEWAPFDWLRLGLVESSVIGHSLPPLNFVLPTLVWHNTYAAGFSNVLAGILGSAAPLPGALLYGEFVVDDVKAVDDPVSGKPNSFAWTLGARQELSLGGLELGFGIEHSHADRWTYVRWQPYLNFYQRQILPGGSVGMDYPLGSPYGPDHDQLGLWLRLGAERATLSLSYECIRKGPVYMGEVRYIDGEYIPIYYDFAKHADDAAMEAFLARPDELREVLRLGADYRLGAGFSARAELSWGRYRNFGHVAGVEEGLVFLYAGILWQAGD